MTFEEFNLDPAILSALKKMDFREPSPIQKKTIPLILNGHDLIALAETGSGKTAACAIPICHRVDPKQKAIQALIIVPTRELALQYATEAQRIGKDKGVKAYALFGGEDFSLQQSKLKAGVQVLVATPGRLIDLIHSRLIDLSEVATLILDEADEMLGMGFCDDLEFIIQCLVHEHQTLLFSATMPPDIKKIASHHMQSPHSVSLISKQAAPKQIIHKFVYCRHHERPRLLLDLIRKMRPKQSLIFCKSRDQVEDLCRQLKKELSQTDFLHGGLNQNLRTSVTNKYRGQKIKHMVATDVASRGLDFSHVTHVFIYQLSDVDTHIHRTGRTGRLGKEGTAITLVTDRELSTLQGILKRLDIKPEWIGPPPKTKR